MTRRLDELDGLRVKTSCATDWSAMTGDDRSRHCEICDKQVYDLSRMTRPEIERLVRVTGGNFCGRMTRHADGRVFSAEDLPVVSPPSNGLVRLRRASPVAAAALGLAVGLTSVSSAKGQEGPRPVGKVEGKIVPPETDSVTETGNATGVIQGTCVDREGKAKSGVSLSLIEGETGEFRRAAVGPDGKFLFENLPAGNYRLFGQAEGFYLASKRVDLGAGQFIKTSLPVDRQEVIVMGDMGYGSRFGEGVLSRFSRADLIVDAKLARISAVGDRENGWQRYAAHFLVNESIKGNTHGKLVTVLFDAQDDPNEHYQVSKRYLLFLAYSEYHNGYGAQDAVLESSTEFEPLRQGMADLRKLEESKASPAEITEWLVRQVESPGLRGSASANLLDLVWGAEIRRESEKRDQPAEESVKKEDPESAEETESSEPETAEARQSPLDFQFPDPDFLTTDQKGRLASVLFGLDTVGKEDRALVDLVRRFDDSRFAPFLLANLKRMRVGPNEATDDLVYQISQLPEFKNLESLVELYGAATYGSSGLALQTLDVRWDEKKDSEEDRTRRVIVKQTLSDQHAFILSAILREAEKSRSEKSENAEQTAER